jgi:hypothetical protein
MIEQYQQLVTELKTEKACYVRLASLALEQKQFLVSGELDKVAENLKRQEKEVFALSPLLGERNDLSAALGKAHKTSDTTLAQIIQNAPLEIVEELKMAVIDLVRSARNLEDINQGNEKLANNALSLADMTLKALARKGRPNSGSQFAKKEETKSSFVNRVV